MPKNYAAAWRIVIAVVVVAVLPAVPLAQRGRSAGAAVRSSWQVPRTSDGRPDLQGDWNFASLTPLQRPARFAGRAWMTDDEAVGFERDLLATAANRAVEGVNEFWLERGTLARIDGRYPTSLTVDPVDGQLPPVTAAARARLASRPQPPRFDSHLDRSVSERCLRSGSGPPYLPGAPDANLLRIVQSRDHIAIVQEKFHDTRVVSIDERPHVSSQIRSWVGDARGRWEGDTLVIDTGNFTTRLALAARLDGNLHLIEKFTRVADNTLLYEFTVDDPTFFSAKWSVRLPMTRTGEQLYEFACHEGNYSLPNMLRGARAQEQSRRE